MKERLEEPPSMGFLHGFLTRGDPELAVDGFDLGSYGAGGDVEAVCQLAGRELPWKEAKHLTLALGELPVELPLPRLTHAKLARTLSRYDVSLSRDAATLEAVTNPRLFATPYQRSRLELRLFDLQDSLGDAGWLKALRLEGYATRNRRRPEALQHPLFSYLGAL